MYMHATIAGIRLALKLQACLLFFVLVFPARPITVSSPRARAPPLPLPPPPPPPPPACRRRRRRRRSRPPHAAGVASAGAVVVAADLAPGADSGAGAVDAWYQNESGTRNHPPRRAAAPYPCSRHSSGSGVVVVAGLQQDLPHQGAVREARQGNRRRPRAGRGQDGVARALC